MRPHGMVTGGLVSPSRDRLDYNPLWTVNRLDYARGEIAKATVDMAEHNMNPEMARKTKTGEASTFPLVRGQPGN